MQFQKKETLLKLVLTRHLPFGHSHPFVYVTPVKGNPFRAESRDRLGYQRKYTGPRYLPPSSQTIWTDKLIIRQRTFVIFFFLNMPTKPIIIISQIWIFVMSNFFPLLYKYF